VPDWSHNAHYHPLVLGAVPPGARRALDAGCGTGALARELRRRVPHCVGLDRDAPTLARARALDGGVDRVDGVDLVLGDLRRPPFRPGSFDLVAAVAVLHHVDARTGLRCLAGLLRPGGVLVVVGLARSDRPADLLPELAAAVAHRAVTRVGRRRPVDQDAPTVPPGETWAGTRRTVREVLPGARFRRHLYWRWSATWTAPGGGPVV
jgi:SAM-dependent methyltransferase